MPTTTTTYNTGSASTSSPLKNEIILSRPSGVYNGGYHSKRRSRESSSNSSNSATVDYIREHHWQSLSRLIKAILKSDEAETKAKAPKALQERIPLPSSLAFPSPIMEGLCMEFARLATELQNGWTK